MVPLHYAYSILHALHNNHVFCFRISSTGGTTAGGVVESSVGVAQATKL